MLTVEQKQLWPGVNLTAVHTRKFKSSLMGVTLLTPLRAETAALNALLPMVLRRGTKRHPTMERLNAALDELYGGAIEPVARKEGETQCVGFLASVLDDAYTLDGSSILEPAARLMGELLLEPYTVEGVFSPEYTEGERTNLIDQIRGIKNEKRQYSMRRLVEEMCRDEAFGVGRYGDEAHGAAIDAGSLWRHYQTLLERAPVELYYCGSAPLERVEAAFTAAFGGLLRGEKEPLPGCEVRGAVSRPREVVERMDVTQGKLALGFRTGGITMDSEEYPALLVFNAVYGGTTTSKLFMNVREKLSLCYFASSALSKRKGLMVVSSGVEFDKVDQAKAEILAQLEACRRGEIEDWELEAAKGSLVSAMGKLLDSQGQLEDHWLVQSVAGTRTTPEELARRIEQVEREQVVSVAQRTALDTVYFLREVEA
jgi:predicted Zn-dependent peptidase